MDRLKQIDMQIQNLEEELSAAKGRETEVYTRIVGYYRAVKNWNKGKREEYNHRICFTSLEHSGKAATAAAAAGAVSEKIMPETGRVISFENEGKEKITGYRYFFRKTCPNCPSVKKYIDRLGMQGEFIDVDTPEGIESASLHQVLAVPTVVFTNSRGQETCRARSVQELKESLPQEMVYAV